MPLLDTTKLTQGLGKKISIHDNCTVLDIGSGAYPRYIEVRLPGDDGPRATAIWDGGLTLAVDDTVICHEYSGSPVLRIASFGGNSSGQGLSGSLWSVVPATTTDILYDQGNVLVQPATDPGVELFSVAGDAVGGDGIAGIYGGAGDGTDNSILDIYGLGSPGSITNRERLRVMYDQSIPYFRIQAEASGTGVARDITIGTNDNTNQLYLATNGGIGVGIAAPEQLFHISGQEPTIFIESNETVITNTEFLGHIDFGTSDTSGGLPTGGVVGRIESIAEADFTASVYPAGLAFYTNATNTLTERMRIDSNGNTLVNNTSSIATWAGEARLQVSHAATGGILAHRETADANSPIIELTKRRSGFGVLSDGDILGSIYFSGADGVDIALGAQMRATVDGTPGSNDLPTRLDFDTTPDGSGSPTTRMSIAPDGFVGIGTISPDFSLQIGDGAVTITNLSTAQNNVFIGPNTTTGRLILEGTGQADIILIDGGGAANDKAMHILTEAGLTEFQSITDIGGTQTNNILVLDHGNGRVGLGTVAAAARLHVDQLSTTAAIPVLYLDQADLSEEMIEFNTTIGTGNPIEAIAAKTYTTTHLIRATLPGGLTRYIPCGTLV